MFNSFENKRGQLGAFQIFFVMAMLFAIAVFIIILYYSWTQMSTPMETALNSAIPDGSATFNVSGMNSKVDGGITLFNVMYPFILLGLIIFALISAFLSKDNPAFLFVALLILGVAILLGVVFSNVFQQLITGTSLQDSGNAFSIIKLFMKGLPYIIGVVAVGTIVLLFSLGRGGGGSQGL